MSSTITKLSFDEGDILEIISPISTPPISKKFKFLRPAWVKNGSKPKPTAAPADDLCFCLKNFSEEEKGRGNLRIGKNGSVDMKGGRGRWASFVAIPGSEPETFKIRSAILDGSAEAKWLCVGSDDATPFASCDTPDTASTWRFSLLSKRKIGKENRESRKKAKKNVADESLPEDGTPLSFPSALKHGGFVSLIVRDKSTLGILPQVLRVHAFPKLKQFALVDPFHPNECALRISQKGDASVSGGRGKWARFSLHQHEDGTVSLASVGNNSKGWHLGVSSDGSSLLGNCSSDDERSRFRLVEALAPADNALHRDDLRLWDESELSLEQLQSFKDDGYLHVPKVVPQDLVHNALRVINNRLGKPNAMVQDDSGTKLRLSGDLQKSPEILDLLYKSPAFTLAQRLMGRDKVVRPNSGQVALRFPNFLPKDNVTGTQWHVDGFGEGRHSPFTLLLGITLSDCLEPFNGNFCVFPGSHKSLKDSVIKHVKDGTPLFSNDGGPKPDLGLPVQVKAGAGDIVMTHQKLAHRGGPNNGPNIRYQIYFRLRHKDHEDLKSAALEDMWLEFEGLKPLCAPSPPKN